MEEMDFSTFIKKLYPFFSTEGEKPAGFIMRLFEESINKPDEQDQGCIKWFDRTSDELQRIYAGEKGRYITSIEAKSLLKVFSQGKFINFIQSYGEDIIGDCLDKSFYSIWPDIDPDDFPAKCADTLVGILHSRAAGTRKVAGKSKEPTVLDASLLVGASNSKPDQLIKRYISIQEYFVKTSAYQEALCALEENSVVFLVGAPGSGKKTVSIKIALDYDVKGYKVYLHNDISGLLGFLDKQESKDKILIVLDDFLGQSYADLKLTNSSELGELIEIIQSNGNFKLLVNSPDIIDRDALRNNRLNLSVNKRREHIKEVKIGSLSYEEKGQLFLSHLKKAVTSQELTKEHIEAIYKGRNYLSIINHPAFSPLIIDHITSDSKLAEVPPDEYVNYIKSVLNDPSRTWEHKYKNLNDHDRLCLVTLYSLTNGTVSLDVLEKCFNRRIGSGDTTINHFADSIERLTGSFIETSPFYDEIRVGVINPSLNDFLHKYLESNEPEVIKIIENALYFEQLLKFASLKDAQLQYLDRYVFVLPEDKEPLLTLPKQIFSDINMEMETPEYLHELELLTLFLAKYGLSESEEFKYVREYTINLIESNFDRIKSDSFFTYELAQIFTRLFDGSIYIDLPMIIKNKERLQILLNIVVYSNKFWEVLTYIRKRSSNKTIEAYCAIKEIKAALISWIEIEIVKVIENKTIEFTMQELQAKADYYKDNDDLVELLYDEIYSDVNAAAQELIEDKLNELPVTILHSEDIDIDTVIDGVFDIRDVIQLVVEHFNIQDGAIEQEKQIKTVINLFEGTMP